MAWQWTLMEKLLKWITWIFFWLFWLFCDERNWNLWKLKLYHNELSWVELSRWCSRKNRNTIRMTDYYYWTRAVWLAAINRRWTTAAWYYLMSICNVLGNIQQLVLYRTSDTEFSFITNLIRYYSRKETNQLMQCVLFLRISMFDLIVRM